MTDPIADMLTRIRNAQLAKKRDVVVPFSKMKKSMADILVSEGYLDAVSEQDGTPKMLHVQLKYQGAQPIIQSLVRESKPGHRVYRRAYEMPHVLNGYGIAIVSTSQGLMTNKKARELGIGGEIICSVY